MTRDRLQEMKKLMGECGCQEIMETSAKEKSTPLIKFCEQVRSIKGELTELKTRVRDFKVLLSDNQQPWLKDVSHRELERQVEEEKLVIGTSAKNIRNSLRAMKTNPPGEKHTSIIARIKEVQVNAVMSELNEILKEYLNCLLQQRERSVKMLKDMIEVKGDDVDDIDSLLEEGRISIFTNNLLMNDLEERQSLREAEERRDHVLKLESTILEIRNLFNELALIVDLQQEKVDEVEKRVDENLVKIESGKKKIVTAGKKRAKIRYRKVIIGIVCGSFILIVLILLTIV